MNEPDEKIVLLHGFTPEEAMKVVRAIKSSVEGAKDAAFATTTETNLKWKLSYLIEHVTEEHRQFREMRDKSAREAALEAEQEKDSGKGKKT